MNSKSVPIQLPLGIGLRDDARFENFVVGSNGLLCTELKRAARGVGEQYIYLWGQAGVGRSHLLQSCCHAADPLKRSAVYLPLAELIVHGTQVLDGMEQLDVVCIDDIDCAAGKPEWEEALFHLFNRIRAENHVLIIAGSAAPKVCGFKLADLESRLNWGILFQVRPLDDAAKVFALKNRARARGFELNEDVARYLMHHGSRDMAHLLVALDTLDTASLSAQRKITIPFVKEVMRW